MRATQPWSGRLAGDRDARVVLVGSGIVLLSLLLTATVPLYLLALGEMVPVNRPVKNMSLFSGPRGSVPAASSW